MVLGANSIDDCGMWRSGYGYTRLLGYQPLLASRADTREALPNLSPSHCSETSAGRKSRRARQSSTIIRRRLSMTIAQIPTSPAGRRVLFLTHTPPLPLVSGDRIRSFHLMRELADLGWTVSLFALAEPGEVDARLRHELEEVCDIVEIAELRKDAWKRYARLVFDIAARRPYQQRYFVDQRAVSRARELQQEHRFDVLVPVTLYMVPYVDPDAHPRTVLDSQNVEARRLETMVAALGMTPRGVAARLQRRPAQLAEQTTVRSVARTVAVSARERDYFELIAPGRTALVANGIDTKTLVRHSNLPTEPSVLFVGSLNYGANVDAITYLARRIMPLVENRDATVTVVGSNPRDAVERLVASSPRMTLAADVASTRPFYETARILAVPLRWGGGTRLKILEAMALGVPVLTTSLGCEGLGLRHLDEVVIADTPEEFAAWIDRLLEDDALAEALTVRARQVVEARYDWRLLARAFSEVLSDVA